MRFRSGSMVVAPMLALVLTFGVGSTTSAHADPPPVDDAPVDTSQGAAAEEPTQVIDAAHPVDTSENSVDLAVVPDNTDTTTPSPATTSTAPAEERGTESSESPATGNTASPEDTERSTAPSTEPSTSESAEPTDSPQPTDSSAPAAPITAPPSTSDDDPLGSPDAQGLELPVDTEGRTVRVATLETDNELSVAGVAWEESSTDVQVFLRSSTDTGDASEWEPIDLAPTSPESSTVGTDPIVVTDAATVQVATVSTARIAPSLMLVDPGTSRADAMATTSTGAPVIYSRADWGANESLRGSNPVYAQVRGVVIHHTAGANSYTQAQVPGIIRGIYSYHTQSLGWSDIGYNVLVDKFGRAWEGRWGGLDRAVQGAHAFGTNHLTFGISLMGNYETAVPPATALDTIARVSGWKMSVHKVDTYATLTSSTKRTFPAISGHRDSYATSCPGRYIYNQMGTLRSKIRGYQNAYAGTVTVTASTAGTKETGLSTNVWGTVAGASNAPVQVQVLVNGRWSTSQKGVSGANGYYALPLTYGLDTPGTYTFRVVATTVLGDSAVSRTVTLTRTSSVRVTASTAGTKETGLGTNVWGTVTGDPHAPVKVQVLVNGRWSTSQAGTSGANGYYALPLTYGWDTPGTYTFRVVATSPTGGTAVSRTVTLTRTSNVGVTAETAGTKKVGQATNVWGTVTGAPHAPVKVQVLVNGRWSTSQVGTAGAHGYYALPLTYGWDTPGTYTFRVVATSPTGGIANSPTVTLTRTP